jgi:hypothetical protein
MEESTITLEMEEFQAYMELIEAAVRLLRRKQNTKPRGRRDGKRNSQ